MEPIHDLIIVACVFGGIAAVYLIGNLPILFGLVNEEKEFPWWLSVVIGGAIGLILWAYIYNNYLY